MTTAARILAEADTELGAEFDLDVTIVESAPVVPALMCDTSDQCGQTCNTDSDQPACVSKA